MRPAIVIRFGQFVLDVAAHELRRDGKLVDIEPKALALLVYLLEHRDRVVSKEELLTAVWPNSDVFEASLTTCVSRLRQALGEHGRSIETQYGTGYRFVSPHDGADSTAAHRRSPFVGRAAELEVLRAAFERAERGRGGLVLVGGAPGVGKTRLVDELSAALAARGRTLLTRCPEGADAPPYWPWIQMLRAYAADTDDELLRDELSSGVPEAVRLVPEVGTLLSAARSAPGRRRRWHDGVHAMLRRSARRAPLLLIVDDLQWADRASLVVLRRLARRLGDVSVLVVATYREPAAGEPTALDRVLPALRVTPGCREVRLPGLTPAAVQQIVAAIAGPAGDAAAGHRIALETGGNPFLVERAAQHLGERAAPASDSLGAPPHGTAELHAERMARLSPHCRRLLSVAAVVGGEFEVAVVNAVLAAEQERTAEEALPDTRASLDEARLAHLIRPVAPGAGTHRFLDALLPTSLCARLGLGERTALHARVGRAMATFGGEGGPPPGTIAEHLVRGAPLADRAATVDFVRRAAAAAADRFDHVEAASWYAKGLASLELAADADARTRLDLLIGLGEAQWQAGMRQDSVATVAIASALARRSGDVARLGRAALARGLRAAEEALDGEYVRLLEEALAGLRTGEDGLRAQLLGRLARAHVERRDGGAQRVALAHRALAMLDRLDDPAARLATVCDVHGALTGPDHGPERLRLASEVVATATRHGLAAALAQGHALRAWDELERGDLDAADRDMAACGRIADAIGDRASRWRHALWQGLRALVAGRWDDAATCADDALTIGRGLDPALATLAWQTQMLTMEVMRGRFAGLDIRLGTLLAGQPLLQVPRAALAYVLARQGRVGDAVQVAEQVFVGGPSHLLWDSTALATLGLVASIYAEAGDLRRCGELYALLAPHHRQQIVVGVNAAVSLGPVARPLGVLAARLGHRSDAEAHFDEAVASCRRMQATPWLAEICEQRARLLPVRGSTAG
jgi:DNA-binding winged helix-turn-helix (wHTH) protein/tetratricopeptide (TPR) repeat protein